jgi:Fungal Zn(2)-Cys(6) binuclear cluster domain
MRFNCAISGDPNARPSRMETITIPSPSAFLRKSPVDNTRSLPHPPPIRSTKNAARRPLASSGQTAITAGVQNGGIAKPKQSKSRNGCITCKGKRLKCDETKPTCEQCRKRNVQCGGYSKAFKWRSFEEANFTGKSGSKPKKGTTSPNFC